MNQFNFMAGGNQSGNPGSSDDGNGNDFGDAEEFANGNGFGDGEDGDDEADDEELQEAMRLLNGDDEDEENEGTNDGSDGAGATQEQLQQEIQAAVRAMSIPEDVIPEDFDPTDSRQLRGVLGAVQQRTALATMGIVFKPVQAAMAQMQQHFAAEMDRKIKEATEGIQGQGQLEQIVPELTDPKLGPIIKNLDRVYKEKGKKPLERAKLIRRMLDTTGLASKNRGGGNGGGSNRSNQNRSSRDSQPGNGAVRTGAAALDFFAPMPQTGKRK